MSLVLVTKHLRREIFCNYCQQAIETLPYVSNKNKNIKRYHIQCSVRINLLDKGDAPV